MQESNSRKGIAKAGGTIAPRGQQQVSSNRPKSITQNRTEEAASTAAVANKYQRKSKPNHNRGTV